MIGWRRRRLRIVRVYRRGIALGTPRDMREALRDFDRTVLRAPAHLPKKAGVQGAIVTVTAVAIALCTSAPAPAAAAAAASAPAKPASK